MFKEIFSKIKGIAGGVALDKPYKFTVDEIGIAYPLSLADDGQSWPLAAYLDQLFEEDYASQLSDRWILPWNEIYRLMDSSEHANSISLLGLPAMATLKPYLASEGGLASDEFKVFINDWKDSESGRSVVFDRIGAFITHSDKTEMLPHASWQLLQAVRQLSKEQHENPGEATNQIGWANIRKIAKLLTSVQN